MEKKVNKTQKAETKIENLPTLRKGTTEAVYVKSLQTELKRQGYYKGAANGKFDEKTEAAVKAFQRALKKPITGIVGPKIWEALKVTGSMKSVEVDPRKASCTVVVDGLSASEAKALVKQYPGKAKITSRSITHE